MAEFEPIDELSFARSARRAQRSRTPRATAARFDGRSGRITVSLDSGIDFSFLATDAHGLAHASAAQLKSATVDGAGSVLAIPALDAHFSIAGLLEGFLGPLDWSRRERRSAASRENGKLGGRPRKALAQG